ncbi:MAG: P-loop NTPase [Candidatus Bathyarchaeia archaeon]
MKIAISGKGGVGKTTIAALLSQAFFEKGYKVLAVDADPNPNLAIVLGLPIEEAEKIVPISENAPLIEEKTGAKPQNYGGVFRISFRVDDIIQRYSIPTPRGPNLIVMGAVRSAGQGCMCPANALVRSLLRYLFTRREEVVIVDLEAGTEHLGRGTAEHVDAMLIVSEPGARSIETAKRISRLAKDAGIPRIFLVGNRATHKESEAIRKLSELLQVPLLGIVPNDRILQKLDIQGEQQDININSSPGYAAIREISDRLEREIC